MTKTVVVPDINCKQCGKLTPSRVCGQSRSYCSKECAFKYVFGQSRKSVTRSCTDCGAAFITPAYTSNKKKCDSCRKIRDSKYELNRRASRKSARNTKNAEAPFDNFVVVGPVFKNGLWYVTLAHKGASYKREMTLAHYRLSVLTGNRLMGTEPIMHKDGDLLNDADSNLELLSKPVPVVATAPVLAPVPIIPGHLKAIVLREAADLLDKWESPDKQAATWLRWAADAAEKSDL